MENKGGMIVRIDENWAVAPERISAFFLEQEDVRAEGAGFRYRSCMIVLIPLSGQAMGKWEILRTRIKMDGDDADVQEIHHRFFLRFLSAGG